MSLPNVPDIDPKIKISKQKALNLLLVSIAMEEIGLSHIINAEAEKLQAVLKSRKKSSKSKNEKFHELMVTNKSINKTLRNVIKKEILLQFKLEDVVELFLLEQLDDDDDDKC